jgi:hypothetical protein
MNENLAWTTDKPTTPGYYLVRGYAHSEDDPFIEMAAVEVGFDHGELCVNLHETNSDANGLQDGYPLDVLDETLEWCPLLPQVKADGAQIAARETKNV